MPPKILYASFTSEVLCFAKTTTDLINMVTRVNILLIQMKKQVVNVLESLLYWKIFGKTLLSIKYFCRDC